MALWRGRNCGFSTSRLLRMYLLPIHDGSTYHFSADSIFFWEIFPEWIFPLLTGLSVFCLANPTSPDFTRIFGGSNGNEGLGLLSICFDWQYISGGSSNPFAIPLQTQFAKFIGYIICM
jgi:hypothetical protein